MNDSYFEAESGPNPEAVRRYKQMLRESRTQYFDVFEFEQIVDYYRQRNRPEAALYALDLAMKQHPKSIVLLERRVEVLLDQKRLEEALPMLRRLLDLNPDNPGIYLLMGLAFLIGGQAEKAAQAFQEFLTRLPANERGNAAYQVGVHYEREERYPDAIKHFEMALEWGIDPLLVYYDLGFCHEKIDRDEQSIEAYQKYLDINPMSPDVWYNMGIAHGKLEQFEQAIRAYEYALALKPDYPSAIFNLANAHGSLEQDARSVELYLEYLQYDPNNAETFLYLGQAYDNLNQPEQAWTHYQKALQLDDSFAETHYSLAVHCITQERVGEALRYIKRGLKLDDQVADYWFVYGNLEFYHGAIDKAIQAYETAVRLMPEHEEAWLNLSEVFFNAGQYDVAAAILDKAYNHNYDKAALNFRLAAYLLLLNDEKGMQHLEEGLQIDPERMAEFTEWYAPYLVHDEVRQLIELYRSSGSKSDA